MSFVSHSIRFKEPKEEAVEASVAGTSAAEVTAWSLRLVSEV